MLYVLMEVLFSKFEENSYISRKKKKFIPKFKIAEKFNDQAVKQLESLKGIFDESKDIGDNENVISISKSQSSSFSNVNGLKSEKEEIKNEVDRNGKLIVKVSHKLDVLKNKENEPKTKIQTEIDIPLKGIHRIIKNEENVETTSEKNKGFSELKRMRNEFDKMNIFSKINNSPQDMAEYIFWTGDEKGVALTIEEFLRERLMTRQEAINFLQSIKYNLDLMQTQYQGLGKPSKEIYNKEVSNLKRHSLNENEFEKPYGYIFEQKMDTTKSKLSDFENDKPDSSKITSTDTPVEQDSYFNKLNFVNDDSSGQDYFEKKNKSNPETPTVLETFDGTSENGDNYDEILQRLKVADILQKEYSLEEVIFELSKLMFSESLKNGNTKAQKAMQRFSSYLQKQVHNGQISENLQKKILEVLLFAFMDALPENSGLLNHSKGKFKMIFDPALPTSAALKQLISLGTNQLAVQSSSKEKLSEKSSVVGKNKVSKQLL